MKPSYLVLIVVMLLSSCAPVLRKDTLQKASFDLNFSEMRENPGHYKGRLYVLGGIIVQTTATKRGALIEALHVPVNSMGYFKSVSASGGRFLALYPGAFLDPLIYREGREITFAGRFVEARKGIIDEMEYVFPLFEIEELYLWAERKVYYREPFYPTWYYPYWWHDPWWRHHYYYY
jgi:outer membrane lipoprotein